MRSAATKGVRVRAALARAASAMYRLCDVARSRWDGLAAALFGLAYFVALTHVCVLDPRRIEVVASGDHAYHALARDFAQWDAWHWPLMRIENYLAPVGTSAVFTDANPWVVLATKVVLPASAPPLQFVGPWLALCFTLQGWFGARIAALATKDRAARALAGALFTTAPVLAHRLAHEALCAHWIVLAMIETALRPNSDARDSGRALMQAAIVLVFAAGVHPTILAMAVPLAIVTAWRHGRPATRPKALAIAAMATGPAAVWIAFGTLAPRVERATAGFGHFSANVLSLVDPLDKDRSALLPRLPHGSGQYEGFGYLGLGALTLAAVAVFVEVRRRRSGAAAASDEVGRARELPRAGAWLAVAIVVILCAVYALSSRVMVGNVVVADLSSIYRPFRAITDAFRSSGRFVWPLHYFVVSASVVAVLRLRVAQARTALVVAVALQLLDAHHVDGRNTFTLGAPPETPSAAWRLARGDYARLVLDPPEIETNVAPCPQDRHTSGSFVPFAQIARSEHLTFNSGQAARVDESGIATYCADLARARAEGRFDPQSVYVFPSGGNEAGLTCHDLDGRRVCVRADRATAFSRVLASPRGPALSLGGDPLVTFDSGFGPAEGDAVNPSRWSRARATLRLSRPVEGPALFAFVGRVTGDEETGRSPRMRIKISGRDLGEAKLENGTVTGTYRIEAPNEAVEVEFELHGRAPNTAAAAEGHAWQLLRLEWFSAT